MKTRSDLARGRQIIERWCRLAEQRLDYLTDLSETGRWRRYYSEAALQENIQEAETAVKTWRLLLAQQDMPNKSAPNASWLDRRLPLPPRRALPPSLQKVADPTRPETGVGVPLPYAPPEQTNIVPTGNENDWRHGLDLAAMQQRYPLLRNAL